MSCVFSHWVKARPCWCATASAVAKALLLKIIPAWGIALELHGDKRTHFTGHIMKQIYSLWLLLQHFHCTYYPQSCGLVERTNGIIKTQLAKFMETLKLTWPKAVPMVLSNLRAAPFQKHKLFPLELVTGRPMNLALAAFDVQLIKGDILHFFKGLIKVRDKNHALENNLFTAHSWETKK